MALHHIKRKAFISLYKLPLKLLQFPAHVSATFQLLHFTVHFSRVREKKGEEPTFYSTTTLLILK